MDEDVRAKDAMSEWSAGQATIIGKAKPRTWQELSQDCQAVFGGGHHTDGGLEAFHHGIRTAFNVVEDVVPPLAEVIAMKAELAAREERVVVLDPLETEPVTFAAICHEDEPGGMLRMVPGERYAFRRLSDAQPAVLLGPEWWGLADRWAYRCPDCKEYTISVSQCPPECPKCHIKWGPPVARPDPTKGG